MDQNLTNSHQKKKKISNKSYLYWRQFTHLKGCSDLKIIFYSKSKSKRHLLMRMMHFQDTFLYGKSLKSQKFSQLLVTTVMWQSMIDKEKIASPCISDG